MIGLAALLNHSYNKQFLQFNWLWSYDKKKQKQTKQTKTNKK